MPVVTANAADITRTYAKDAGEFQALIDAVDTLQQDICGQVKAGMDYRVLHMLAHRKIGDALTAAGITSGSTDSLIRNDVTSAFYPHGLGHLLGLQVHDVGGFMESESGVTIDPTFWPSVPAFDSGAGREPGTDH